MGSHILLKGVGGAAPDGLKCKAKVYFDGQSIPYEKNLKINVQHEQIEIKWASLYEHILNADKST